MANKTFKSLTPQGLDTTYKVPATAPEYAATNTYAVGDLAVYQGVLYKCTTAIDTPEAWTVQHWQDTTIGDEVSTLKESISQVTELNLFNPNEVTTGAYIAQDGTITSRSGAGYSGFIPVSNNEILMQFDTATTTQTYYLRVYGYDSNKGFTSEIYNEYIIPIAQTISKTITIPDGISYIRVSWYIYTNVSNVLITNSPDGVTAIDKEARRLKTSVDAAVKTVTSDEIVQQTMFTRSDLTAGIIKTDGTATSSSSAGYTAPFAVEPGEVLTVKKYYLNSSGVLAGETDGVFGSYVFYEDNTYAGKGWGAVWNANASSIKIPEGIHYIQVTITAIMTGTYTHAIITRTKPNGETTYYIQQNTFKNPYRFNGALAANTYQLVGNKICTDEYVFSAAINISDTFTSFKVGGINQANNAFSLPTIEITPTQIIMKSNTDSQLDITQAHGLTISNDLQVIIIQHKGSLTATVIVQSTGERYTLENARLGSIYFGWAVYSADGATYADISYSVCDLYKPVWVCGDSWVTKYDTRWYGQAISLGIKNFLKSGHAGEGSKEGLEHLKTLLSMYTPKMVVWMYGMNDADTNDSTPNADWLVALNELKTICSNNVIDLILATIPTTPTRNNNAKNAIVVASGYRYVDEVTAMGADTSGNWITGYQSGDGNHTTEAGAKALLVRVLADVPEIAIS